MIDWLEQMDQAMVIAVNQWHHPILDDIMWNISGKWQWIPLYVYLLYMMIKKYDQKVLWPILSVVMVIVLTDQTSVHLFKEVFQRYRPCHHLELKPVLELVHNKCGGKYGFVSSHAANSFGLAVIMTLLFKEKRGFVVLLLIWASVVAFSRVYMAVHYVSDVFFGALLGALLAFMVHRFFKFKWQS